MTTLLFCALGAFSLITNREELRFASCPEQVSDFSCGQAAVSGLLVHTGRTFSQHSGSGFHPGAVPPDPSTSPRFPDRRMSALEILQLLRAHGLDAAAFKIDYRSLPAALALGAPVIAHYDWPTLHFVLVYALNLDAGAASGTILVADPVEGSMVMPLRDFLARWSGVVIVARPGVEADMPAADPRIPSLSDQRLPGERPRGEEAVDRWLCLQAVAGFRSGLPGQRFP